MARSHEEELMAHIKAIHAMSDFELEEASYAFHKLAERAGKKWPDRAQFNWEVLAVLMAEMYQRASKDGEFEFRLVPREGWVESLGL